MVLEFPSFPREKQLHLLYQSAFKISQQVLGPKHKLTEVLKIKGGVEAFEIVNRRIKTEEKKRE